MGNAGPAVRRLAIPNLLWGQAFGRRRTPDGVPPWSESVQGSAGAEHALQEGIKASSRQRAGGSSTSDAEAADSVTVALLPPAQPFVPAAQPAPNPPVAQDVSWRLMPGQRAGLVGANGCGKSTLLRVLAGLRHVDTGSARVGAAVQVGPSRGWG